MHPVPTEFQKKVCWAALTALGMLAIAASAALVVYLAVRVIGFLQPVLLPLAVAVILAYLLEPFVAFLCRRRFSRTAATLVVFFVFFLCATGLLLSVVPTAFRQGALFLQNLPAYSEKFQALGIQTLESLEKLQSRFDPAASVGQRSATHLPAPSPALPEPAPHQNGSAPQATRGLSPAPQSDTPGNPENAPGAAGAAPGAEKPRFDFLTKYLASALNETMGWLQNKIPDLVVFIGNLLQRSLGGFLGAFGLIIGFILIPVFLFYLLRDAPSIVENWADFLPLRSSPFKTEVVSLLTEINGYIIAFFRGQILVAVIDGAIIAVALLIMGLEFAVLIGLLVATLGVIPYAGTILTWGPAVLIAVAQYGDWFHPLVVTLIFVGVNQLDSLFITPWVLGESVGLHSLTVMVAVLFWTVIIGGLLGALLAVPLTAALKVVARRYLWDKKLNC